jgi:hypothetical protein
VDYFSVLALQLGLASYGSRLTVLDGKNGVAFITDAMYSVDVDRNFTVSEFNTRKFLTFYRILLIPPPMNAS